MKTFLVVAAASIVGGYAFNRFIAGRFVEQAEGFGLDDVAHAATVAGTFYLLWRFTPLRKIAG